MGSSWRFPGPPRRFASVAGGKVVFSQPVAKKFEALFGRVHHAEQIQVCRRDSARVNHDLEVDQALPVLAAID